MAKDPKATKAPKAEQLKEDALDRVRGGLTGEDIGARSGGIKPKSSPDKLRSDENRSI